MSRFIAFIYGLASYILAAVTLLYAIGFVSGLVVPKTIDTGISVPIAEAIIVNLFLMSVFALQHSVMARKPFKKWWTQFVPESIERSTYVLFSESRAHSALLAVASDTSGRLAHRQSADRRRGDGSVTCRLADRADQHVSDQPLRTVRAGTGLK